LHNRPAEELCSPALESESCVRRPTECEELHDDNRSDELDDGTPWGEKGIRRRRRRRSSSSSSRGHASERDHKEGTCKLHLNAKGTDIIPSRCDSMRAVAANLCGRVVVC